MTKEQATLIRFAAAHGFKAVPTEVVGEPAISVGIPWTKPDGDTGVDHYVVDNMRDLKLELGY